ncbi:MAG: 30S ribosomal protein S13 [Thermoplasmata archaeon]|nr:MAG: 30S ribosomal protein S13 [Thermoplasmata archaeon]
MAEEEKKDDFKYIVRLASTDVNGKKPVRYALTQIKGIGNSLATVIADEAGVDRNIRIGKLSDEEISKLDEIITSIQEWAPPWMRNRRRDRETGNDLHLIGAEIELKRREDINLLKKIRAYRGIRHEKGLPVRGQRTRANKRSGLTVGVSRKRLRK